MKILSIEDNEADFGLLEKSAEDTIDNIEIIHKLNISSALTYLKSESDVNLVFLDLSLSDGSEPEENVKKIRQHTLAKIILLSGMDQISIQHYYSKLDTLTAINKHTLKTQLPVILNYFNYNTN